MVRNAERPIPTDHNGHIDHWWCGHKKSDVIVQFEKLKGTMTEANHVERCFAAGMMCITNFKLERELGRFGVEFDD